MGIGPMERSAGIKRTTCPYHADMRFTVREGSDPVAAADRVMLAAMGMPGGGIVQIGNTHVLIRPRETDEETALLLGPQAMANAGVRPGDVVDAKRRLLPPARRVVLEGDRLPAPVARLVRALQGRPLTAGDTVTLDASYLGRGVDSLQLHVTDMEPPAAVIGAASMFLTESDDHIQTRPAEPASALSTPETPTTAEALMAGLDLQRDLLTGWLRLLTSPENLPVAWGLPQVAGIFLEGPTGCGKSELVSAAADAVGVPVREINVNLIFKPQRLLDVLEEAAKRTPTPHVVFVDRLEAVAGEEGLAPFRTQVAAVLRWFLDTVAGRPGLACVLGVTSIEHLDGSISRSPLVPRSLTIPPPDLERRRLLFQAALAKVPARELDYDVLAARSAGFSGADVVAAVVHASALVAGTGNELTTKRVVEAIESTTPSLGSMMMGEVPSYGFDQVADLAEVKQRLTEAVIWPVTDADRFVRLGIEPPRGILLHGPPGTGKTFVIRAVAHESGAAFFSVKGAELLDKFVGESERGVREVFARARAAAPSLLFFDELDALAPVRGRSMTTVTDSVVAALLTELDGIGARGDVAVVAATNRKDLIDPALLRPGRFEVQIQLDLPTREARRALLDLSDVPFTHDVDLDRLAEATAGLSFADVAGLLREAALDALRSDAAAMSVTWAQLERALARIADMKT
jgi:transitional endoplasmic reticulum ATPase